MLIDLSQIYLLSSGSPTKLYSFNLEVPSSKRYGINMIFNQILTWLSRTNSTHKKALDCIASSIIAVLLVVSEIR